MTYPDFLRHKYIQSHAVESEGDLPNTFDLWYRALTQEQRMKFIMEWEGLKE